MLLRRTPVLPVILSYAVVVGFLAGSASGWSQKALSLKFPIVQTDKGKIAGVPTDDGKVIAYKGIPFAAPPVEELRWKAPQPAAKWRHVFPAAEFGHRCIQSSSYPDMIFHDSGPSEDCLTLNVWAPVVTKAASKAAEKKGGLPVMVWIYGGGYVSGGTSERRQDGEFLAQRGVVVVSMNYRLGIFGFMALPDLEEDSGHGSAGNYGLMDQAAGIAWVKRNIAEFGGDPENITIFGESVGSFSVSALTVSPMAKGLFSKAIGESGGAFFNASLNFRPKEECEKEAAAWAEHVFGSSRLFFLRSVPAEELLKAALSKTVPAPRFIPDVDGFFLPDSVPNLYAASDQANVPLLAGWNADENSGEVLFAKTPVTASSFAAQAKAEFGADAPRFLSVFPAGTDAEAVRSAKDLAGDRFIAFSTWKWIEAAATTGHAPVYRYRFDQPSPGDANHPVSMGAFHSDDIEYVFGTLNTRPGAAWRPEDRRLSEMMGEYWVNFARTGDPNAAGLPKWPVYGGSSGWQVMHLDATPAARPDTMRGRYEFLDGVWGKARN